MTRGRIITVLFLLIGVGAAVIALTAASEANPKKSDPSTPVKPVERKLVCTGKVDTEKPHYYVFPDSVLVPSKVLKVLVNEGDEVVKDQPLLELDKRYHEKQVELAEQLIQQAKVELEKAERARELHPQEVKAATEAALAKYAQINPCKAALSEAKRLRNIGSATDLDVATAEAKLEAATREYEAAKILAENLSKKPVDLAVNAAQLAVDFATKKKEEAALAMSKMVCLAPVNGKIARCNAFVGMIFGPQTKEPAFVIHESGPLIVRAEVQQEFASRIPDKATCKIEDQDDARGQWTGRIIRIADFFGPRRHTAGPAELIPLNDARVLEVIIQVDTPKDAPKIRIGQQVRIVIATD
jgi:multidrug efflux pump subunit AcrA (membrane-fusion protein)